MDLLLFYREHFYEFSESVIITQSPRTILLMFSWLLIFYSHFIHLKAREIGRYITKNMDNVGRFALASVPKLMPIMKL